MYFKYYLFLRSKLRKTLRQNSTITLPPWLIYFDTLNSTNNYAMKRIDDGLAQNGEVIWTLNQTFGKGQRGKYWETNANENLTMSLIAVPERNTDFFSLIMAVSVTIVSYLSLIYPKWQIGIKWTNDIFINNKKAGGILIENVFKGKDWNYCVIGIGINVLQKNFPENLPLATSLLIESGKVFDIFEIIKDLRSGILNKIRNINNEELLQSYNNLLHLRNKEVTFIDKNNNNKFTAVVCEATATGEIILQTHEGIKRYHFGELEWILI